MRRRSILVLVALVALTAVWSQAAAQAVGNAPRYMERGNKLFRQRDYAGAAAEYQKVLAIQPTNAMALAWRGLAYTELGDYPRAIDDHDAVLRVAPDSPGALTNVCWARALSNTELERALTYCDRAVALSPDGRTLDTRGFLRFRRGEFELAVSDYTAALKRQPRQASALYGRGVAELRLGREAEGQADLKAGMKIEPSIAETYARRGVTP